MRRASADLCFVVALIIFGKLNALSQQAGTLRWKVNLGSEVRSSPAIAPDGNIYVAAYDLDSTRRAFYSITPQGTTNWVYIPGGAIFGSPTIGTDGAIYFGTTDRRIYSISRFGTTNWTFLTGGQILSTPAVAADGTVYVCAISNWFNKLYAIHPDGSPHWIFSMGPIYFRGAGWPSSSPAIGPDGSIYIGSLDAKLYSVSPNGKTNWTFDLGSATYSSPAIGPDGTIYVGTDDFRFYAVDSEGRKKWQISTGAIQASAAIDASGVIYVGSTLNQLLFAISPTGALIWSRNSGGMASTPALADSQMLFVTSYSRSNLTAVTSSGSFVWSYPLPDASYSSPAIGADGTIYFGAGTNLYALYGSNNLASAPWPLFQRESLHQARAIQCGLTAPSTAPDGSAVITLTVETNRSYRVEVSSDLRDWTQLTGFVSTLSVLGFRDIEAKNFSRRFYRLATLYP